MAKQRSPKSDDVAIGQRVRMARLMANLSQTALGEKIGVTFQQVQKYEKGGNRIGGSRMIQIAQALGVTVASLFEDGDDKKTKPGADLVRRMLIAPYGLDLAKSYLAMKHNQDRHIVATMAERLAGI